MSNLLNNITQSRQTLPTDATSNAYVSSVDSSKATNTYVNSTFTTESYVDAEVAGIINSAPATLDTLNELAAALGDDPNFATTVTNSIATKASNTYVNTQLDTKVDETHTGDVEITGTIQDSQGNVRVLQRTGITSSPYALPANSSGKYFSCGSGSGTITIDSGDCEEGQIITIYNNQGTNVTISWTNMTNNVFIAGDNTALGTSGSVTLDPKGLVTIISDVATRLVFSGNVS